MKVSKFGGTSLATAKQIRKVYDIILSDPNRRIIVVSAPGKRFIKDIKVTDLLIDYAKKYLSVGEANHELALILERFLQIADELELGTNLIDEIKSDIIDRTTSYINNDKNTFIESIKAIGEDVSAKILASYLQSREIEAQYINPKNAGLLLSNEHGNARVLEESYDNLKILKEMSGILVFPGFFGYSPEGNIVTFPRGGSDITGSILAAALNAELYENFTDVDSVYVVNPKIIKNPKKIYEMTFKEMRELSYAGFTVFNEEALMPAYYAGIPVNIKNTNNPNLAGTMIISNRSENSTHVTGIASDNGFCSIYVSKYLMNREIGFGRKLLEILENEGLAYEHTPSGIDNISIILKQSQFTNEVETRIVSKINNELQVDDILIKKNLALIMIVGEGMRQTIGLAARATNALSSANVNIEMINQGSSEVSMMFGIRGEDEIKAVMALYDEFFSSQNCLC